MASVKGDLFMTLKDILNILYAGALVYFIHTVWRLRKLIRNTERKINEMMEEDKSCENT